jgi:hypothetical protein
MAQLYINDLSFMKIYPMKTKSEVSDSLVQFIQDVGIPHAIHSDAAPELIQGRFRQLCKDYHIHPMCTEPYSPWQNRAEGGIRELKRMVHRKMTSKRVPVKLWDFCSKWVCEIKNKSASSLYAAEDRTLFAVTLGHTPDISSFLPFDFYDPIWYHEEMASFPEPKLKVGRWLGEAQDFGQAMCYWVLSEEGKPKVCSTVQNVPIDKLKMPEIQGQIAALDKVIADRLGSPSMEDSIYKYDLNDNQDLKAPEHMTPEYVPLEPDSSMLEADEWDAEAFNKYIFMEVCLPKNGQEVIAKVIARKRDHDGNPIGR